MCLILKIILVNVDWRFLTVQITNLPLEYKMTNYSPDVKFRIASCVSLYFVSKKKKKIRIAKFWAHLVRDF